MVGLRIFLGLFVVCLSVYTILVIADHGWNLFPFFFGDLSAFGWPGQFNLDFTGFLMLSALWTAWRNRFSPLGFALGVVAFFGGMMFLAIYLIILSWRTGSVDELLTGRTPP